MAQLSYRQVSVGRLPVGVLGLDELFDELYAEGHHPNEDGLGMELVTRVQEHNYIAKPAVDDYAQALLREYRKYVELRMRGCTPQTAGYGTWQGHPREHIPWFPTLAADLCDGCGACLKFCSFGVYAPDSEGKVMVTEPFRCQVGCSSCVNICSPRAIAFPPRAILEAFRPRD